MFPTQIRVFLLQNCQLRVLFSKLQKQYFSIKIVRYKKQINQLFKAISLGKGKATSSFLICLTVERPASKAHKLTKAIAPCVAKAIHFPSKSLLLHSIMKNIQTANPHRFIQEQSVRTGTIFLQEAKINAKLNQN